MMSWLVSWAADEIFRYKVHSSGRTSHKWITGHRCDQPVAGFGENINFKFTTDKNHMNKMNTEWCTGYFLGVSGKTIEYLVATSDGIFSCATIRRLPDEEAYDPECIQAWKIIDREYVLEGTKSAPIGVRVGETNIKNAEMDPTTAPMVPRRA